VTVAGAILLVVAMALVFPPLVFGGGLVLSALFGHLLSTDGSTDGGTDGGTEQAGEQPVGQPGD
jgi:hypothetical protein